MLLPTSYPVFFYIKAGSYEKPGVKINLNFMVHYRTSMSTSILLVLLIFSSPETLLSRITVYETTPRTLSFDKLITLQFAPLRHGWLGYRVSGFRLNFTHVCQHSVRSPPVIRFTNVNKNLQKLLVKQTQAIHLSLTSSHRRTSTHANIFCAADRRAS